jgi:hypothetical protein
MDKTHGTYECGKCSKKYSSYKSLWNHNKKFHTHTVISSNIGVINTDINVINSNKTTEKCTKKYSCNYCDKQFELRQYKWSHEKSCKIKAKNIEKIQIDQLIEENKKLKLELTNKPNNKSIITKNNINTNNNTLNTNNGTINNNIIIKSIGNESVMSLTAAEIKEISTSGSNALLKVIKFLNFNKDRPENHSFCVTSLDGNHVTYHDNVEKQKIKVTKNEFFDRILLNSKNKLDEITIRLEFDEDEQNKEVYLDNINSTLSTMFNPQNVNELGMSISNKKIKNVYSEGLNDLSYNNKAMVQKTWSQAKYESDIDYDSDSSFEKGIDLNEAVRRVAEKQKNKLS